MMKIFKRKQKVATASKPVEPEIDRSQWTGKDFEFLITGDIEIASEKFDQIMTPSSFVWTKILREDWIYYQIGEDEFSYSWEMPGIQMTFNDSISYEKARQIADEVVEHIRATGQAAELVVINATDIVFFPR